MLVTADQAARANAARLRAVFAGAAVGIAIGDTHGRVVEANRCLAEMLGYDIEDLRGVDICAFVHPHDAPDVRAEVLRLIAVGRPDEVRVERRLIRRDGGVRWVLLAISLVPDDAGGPSWLVMVGQDVTDRHNQQLQLRHQAFHDPLTGLPNRALFAERIDQIFHAPAPAARIGLCFLDLDGFKEVNDSFGHDVGDRLLTAVAERLDGCVTADGHLLARIGGDEFVILAAGPGAAVRIADRVMRVLASPFRVGRHDLWVSASIGVVERPVAATSAADLLRAADVTMYRAKADGKCRWISG